MADDLGDRVDFSSLDPTENQARFERIVKEIARRAIPELAARRARPTVFAELQAWRRPMLAAAAVFAVTCVGVLASVSAPQERESGVSIAEAMGLPTPVADWLYSDELPSVAELLVGLEETR